MAILLRILHLKCLMSCSENGSSFAAFVCIVFFNMIWIICQINVCYIINEYINKNSMDERDYMGEKKEKKAVQLE